jgi:lipopolysaccharide transport system permease protein
VTAQKRPTEETLIDAPGEEGAPPDTLPVVFIRSSKGGNPLELREVWEFRELLYFLIWRDIKVRYKQTVLGAAWAIVQPFLTMVVFSIFLGYLGRMPSEGAPYPIFTYCGLLPWTLFANALNQAANSLVLEEKVITKVYFPRVIVPMAAVLAGLMDFAIAFVVLIGMMLFYGVVPGVALLTIPLFVLLAAGTALAVGLWLAALNVKYRDVRYAIPFLIQFWLFATPVAYPSSLIPEPWRTIYGLNPMAGVVEGFRWALLHTEGGPGPMLALSALTVVGLLTGGLYYFRRLEESFADLV